MVVIEGVTAIELVAGLGELPPSEAVHEVALIADQDNAEICPGLTEVGLAVKVITGGGVFGGAVITLNIAPTLLFSFITIGHDPVPEHAPVQPANVEPLAGVAMSVIENPFIVDTVHKKPH